MTPQDRRISQIAWLSLASFAALWAARWPSFPLSLDPYYHLIVAGEVADAGGPIAYEWWQAAPGGRPHLYPPVLHLLLSGALRAGLAPLDALRLFSVLLPVGLLMTVWITVRRLYGARTGLACLAAMLMPFAFHLHSAITMAASLGMMLLLWLMVAVAEQRWKAAGLLLAVVCYTHLGLPAVAVIALAAAGAMGAARWRVIVNSAWGLVLALPWYAHLAIHRGAFDVFPRKENEALELSPVLYALAAAGVWAAWRGPRERRWPAALLAGFALWGLHHQFRLLTGEGMLAVALLAGFGAVALARRRLIVAALVVAALAGPTLIRQEDGAWRMRWADAAPWHLVNAPWIQRKAIDISLASPQVRDLAGLVARESRPGEIVWSNTPYALGLIAALAHRPMASVMFAEVRPAAGQEPAAAAHVLVWMKIEPFPGTVSLAELEQGPVARIADTELAIVLRQAGALPPAHAPEAAMPGWLAAGLVGLALGAAAADLAGSRQRAAIPI